MIIIQSCCVYVDQSDQIETDIHKIWNKVQILHEITKDDLSWNFKTICAANEETGCSLMQANVNLLYRSTSFYTLSEAARFKQIGS